MYEQDDSPHLRSSSDTHTRYDDSAHHRQRQRLPSKSKQTGATGAAVASSSSLWAWPFSRMWTGGPSSAESAGVTTTTTTTTTSGVDEAAGPCAECVRLKRENVRLTWELGEREGLCRALAANHERLQLEKEALLVELEQLSQALFQEANRMVSEERIRSNELELKNKELSQTLDRTLSVINSTASSALRKRNSLTGINPAHAAQWAALKCQLAGTLSRDTSTLDVGLQPPPLPGRSLEGIKDCSFVDGGSSQGGGISRIGSGNLSDGSMDGAVPSLSMRMEGTRQNSLDA